MHQHRSKVILISIMIFLILGGLAGFTWVNYRFAVTYPGGHEFLSNWLGSRLFLTEGQSPYSVETTAQIQRMAYGRLAKTGEDPLLFTNPLYSIVIFAPFALISDFNIARSLWMTLLESALIALALISLRISAWKPNLFGIALFLLVSLLWFHAVNPLLAGNVTILVALFTACGIWAIQSREDELAGVLFAFATIEPQFVILLIMFLLGWSLFAKRMKFILWFFISLAFLGVSATFLHSNWIIENVRTLVDYFSTGLVMNPANSLAKMLPGIGNRVGWMISGVILAIIVIEWMKMKKASGRNMLWVVCLTLVGGAWSGIPVAPENFILFFPAIPLICALFEERWHKVGRWISITLLFIFGLGVWVVYLSSRNLETLNAILFFPVVSLLIFLLYWVRHWAMSTSHTWVELLEQVEKKDK